MTTIRVTRRPNTTIERILDMTSHIPAGFAVRIGGKPNEALRIKVLNTARLRGVKLTTHISQGHLYCWRSE